MTRVHLVRIFLGAALAFAMGCMRGSPPCSQGREEIGSYLAEVGLFRLPAGVGQTQDFQYGAPHSLPVSGDWDGDGCDSVGVFSAVARAFFLIDANTGGYARYSIPATGREGSPVAGDWDGDGRDGVGLFDWEREKFLLSDAPAVDGWREISCESPPGSPASPISGDWTGGGRDGVGLYRHVDGGFVLCTAEGAPIPSRLVGRRLGVPLAGDWDGSGRATPAVVDRATGEVWATGSTEPIAVLRAPPGPYLPIVGRWLRSGALRDDPFSTTAPSVGKRGQTTIPPLGLRGGKVGGKVV